MRDRRRDLANERRRFGYRRMFILTGLYTGTRHRTILGLHGEPTAKDGWVDLDQHIIHRRGAGEEETTKRRTKICAGPRLTAHLKRRHRHDHASGRDPRPRSCITTGSPTAASCTTLGRTPAGWPGLVTYRPNPAAHPRHLDNETRDDPFRAAGFLGVSPEGPSTPAAITTRHGWKTCPNDRFCPETAPRRERDCLQTLVWSGGR